MCEAFLGVLPHFHFFQHFFYLRPIPNASKPTDVGGAELVLHPENENEYLSYQPSSKGVDWKSFWFYVGNFESPLPERALGAPKAQVNWMNAGPVGFRLQQNMTVIIYNLSLQTMGKGDILQNLINPNTMSTLISDTLVFHMEAPPFGWTDIILEQTFEYWNEYQCTEANCLIMQNI